MKKNNVNFNFIATDKPNRYAYNKALPLVKFILGRIEFLPYISLALTTYTFPRSLEQLDRKGKNKFDKWVSTLDFENEESYKYVNEFYETFKNTYNIHDDFPEDTDNKKIEQTLRDVRGEVLEQILREFIYPRYKTDRSNPYGKKFNMGCKIELNGKQLILDNRISVDIAAWDGYVGEFYEAKVGPDHFDEDVLKLLSLIKDEVDKHEIVAQVGCVTMVNKDKLILVINSVRQKYQFNYNDKIVIYGKDELIKLKEHPIAA